MTGPAEIRLKGRSGMFVADRCQITGNWIHAEGRWRTRLASGLGWSEPRAYTWTNRIVEEVRWQRDEVTA